MVARGLGGTVGAVGLVFQVLGEELIAVCHMVLAAGSLGAERRDYPFGIGQLQSAVHLVGADMVKQFALPFFR